MKLSIQRQNQSHILHELHRMSVKCTAFYLICTPNAVINVIIVSKIDHQKNFFMGNRNIRRFLTAWQQKSIISHDTMALLRSLLMKIGVALAFSMKKINTAARPLFCVRSEFRRKHLSIVKWRNL